MSWLNTYKHLLPKAKAWRITIEKTLRRFFEGLTGLPEDVETYTDLTYSDLDPQQTRELTKWETQFALANTGLTEQERRDRLEATWSALGGQSPRYIQDTLQAAGFDVYVHEWWVPGSEPAVGVKACVTPRNPLLYLRSTSNTVIPAVDCGEALAQCGEAFAECGNTAVPRGYPLVNKILETVPDYFVLCGEAGAECGEAAAECGNFSTFLQSQKEYVVPTDPAKWAYFLYIGAATFPNLATIDPKRRDEFEALCLKIGPTQLWLGMLIE